MHSRFRDAAAAGKFVYAVKTTGIYCLPGCRPDEPDCFRNAEREMVIRACRAVDASETAPTITTLAAEGGFSPGHFHRVFKK